MTNDFINAIFNNKVNPEIKVTFTNGQTAIYTKSILSLLMTDNDVAEIMDMETGELLKY